MDWNVVNGKKKWREHMVYGCHLQNSPLWCFEILNIMYDVYDWWSGKNDERAKNLINPGPIPIKQKPKFWRLTKISRPNSDLLMFSAAVRIVCNVVAF